VSINHLQSSMNQMLTSAKP